MAGGTEAFPDLGRHCQHPDCNLLDFLPFICNACSKTFCLEHRSYKSHECPNSEVKSRKVLVCEICSTAVETTGHDGDEEKKILEKHEKSGECDPRKKKKPICSVRRCKQVLTFSNTATCKSCGIQTCLRHRFPADHACCRPLATPHVSVAPNIKLLNSILAARKGIDCGSNGQATASPSAPSVKAH